ncbi:M15 family metallopeptidase [Paenibacillus protaetiae]|uniref:D-alanyl-D-alanine carboxypeptidase family protein n=1 Tax=Paenibacillus protaetiae TaxID=2509456 RepID=A0A4P6FAW9_9BACL|nr:M15 family metallopeptidase [Paenibacillus protaetiae]QAY67658.1 D-alanyl-D-alanine carboxypeptidase family protein [Paenibacillus protaetiae]
MSRGMSRKKKRARALLLFVVVCIVAIGGYQWISNSDTFAETDNSGSNTVDAGTNGGQASPSPSDSPAPSDGNGGMDAGQPSDSPSADPSETPSATPEHREVNADGIPVAAQADSITALINKENSLPDDFDPTDLVYPDVPFIFKEKIEKRMMRKEAAGALEKLFAGAEKDGIHLAGVSAYRSYKTQRTLFDNYVKKDGYDKARTYSAIPGTSEHQTGLAIDVSGSDGKCAAESCFGGTPEATWLAAHASEYGFIIRYPEGKENITGYKYEPWHLRYVGEDLAKELDSKGETLEEYYNTVPVNQ